MTLRLIVQLNYVHYAHKCNCPTVQIDRGVIYCTLSFELEKLLITSQCLRNVFKHHNHCCNAIRFDYILGQRIQIGRICRRFEFGNAKYRNIDSERRDIAKGHEQW